jgi:2-polyprenyl-6-methoxyphenol hydroxylase-like FAD-dependent oxidoreductase
MRYEVAVVGAGPAGAVAAATLARQGRHVLLLDGGQRPSDFTGGESLPPLAPALRQDLALGTVLASGAHLPCYGNAAAWGSPELQYQHFITSPYGAGWHLDRPAFDAALREQAGAAGAQLLAGQLRALRPAAPGGWHLHLQTPGGEQPVCAAWGLQLGQAYQHHDRLVAYCRHYGLPAGAAPDDDRLTLVEAAPWGWGHSAGLPGGARAVTLFADAGQAGTRRLGTPAGFDAALLALPQLTALLRTPGYAPLGAPRATDARTGRLAQPVGAGWLAAGDAATAFDPLAAQGILAAVWAGHRSALALGQALAGDATALPVYAQQVHERFTHLWAQSRHFYGQERRWASEPFWQARQQPTDAAPTAFLHNF